MMFLCMPRLCDPILIKKICVWIGRASSGFQRVNNQIQICPSPRSEMTDLTY